MPPALNKNYKSGLIIRLLTAKKTSNEERWICFRGCSMVYGTE